MHAELKGRAKLGFVDHTASPIHLSIVHVGPMFDQVQGELNAPLLHSQQYAGIAGVSSRLQNKTG